jgi:hypothetical protein
MQRAPPPARPAYSSGCYQVVDDYGRVYKQCQ